MLGNTLAASFIWGINTIFLLDAGLSNLEAFAANAFFTAGMVLFEVPTGIVADTVGRRASYLLGTRDADRLDPPLRAAVADRGAVLGSGRSSRCCSASASPSSPARSRPGSSTRSPPPASAARSRRCSGAGRSSAARRCCPARSPEASSPSRPAWACRSCSAGVVLVVMFVVAFRLMHDVGFTPEKGGRPLAEMRKIAADSIEYGWRVPAVKWLMVESLFTGGVGVYAFYALQPYLLELYGDPQAYQVAGLVAAIVAGAQIVGGIAAPRIRRLFRRRTSALLATPASASARWR